MKSTLVGFFCGVLYGLILGYMDMDNHATRCCMEQIDAPSRPQDSEHTCTTLAPVPPHET